MTLVWNNVQSFRRHVEAMKTFRRTHSNSLEDTVKLLKDMPTVRDIQQPVAAGGTSRFTGKKRISVVVPIWGIKLPKGSQN